MSFTRLLSGAALAAVLTTTAAAQPAAAPSPEKMALAKQIVDASGGADQMKTLVQTVFRTMRLSLNANVPAEQKRVMEVILQKMQDRFAAATPQLVESTVQIYAQTLTDKEMRDYLAWQLSESGQSLKRKMPQIALETVKVLAPVITQLTQGLKQDVLDEACKQANCSRHDREVLATAMEKSMPMRENQISGF